MLGGPIQKNKTFFFVDWQGTRLNTGVIRTSTVPTVRAEDAASSPRRFLIPQPPGASMACISATRFPATRFHQRASTRAAQAVWTAIPPPTSSPPPAPKRPPTTTGASAMTTPSRISSTDALDRYFGTAHRIFGRYSFLRDDSRPTTPLPDGSGTSNRRRTSATPSPAPTAWSPSTPGTSPPAP